jgi:hypothetical protein
MAHSLTIEVPDEVYDELASQAKKNHATLEEIMTEWLKEQARSQAQIVDGSLRHSLLRLAREKYRQLPQEILPALSSAEPNETQSSQDLIACIEAYDLVLDTAKLTNEERSLLNRSLDEVIAVADRLLNTIRSTKESFQEKPEAA